MTSWKIVLYGFLRHVITLLGTWLVARGYLESSQVVSWTETAVTEIAGAVMILGAQAWSAIDKQKVIGWILHALHLDAKTSPDSAAKLISASIVGGQ